MVTVIVPVYNCEASIERCVKSIQKQTYSDLEIILVDDGSKDRSGELCDEYARKDSRIKVIHKKNGGVSAARNTGIEHATGKYIQFVDSDDYIVETMTEKLVRTLEQNQTQFVICGYEKIIGEHKEKKLPRGVGKTEVSKMDRENTILIKEFLLNSPWNKLYVASYIKEGFNQELSLGEDLLFNLAYLSEIETVSILAETLYCYVEQEGSLSNSYRSDKLVISEILWKQLGTFAKVHGWCTETVQCVNHVFMSNVIYGCYDIWKKREKVHRRKSEICSWIENDSVQEAVHDTFAETSQQKLAQAFIKKKRIYCLMGLYQIKKMLGK